MKLLRARVTSKGQVTLPKPLRDSLGIQEGDHVEFSVLSTNSASIRSFSEPCASAGVLRHLAKEKTVTVEEMDEGIRLQTNKRYAQLRENK